MNYLKKRKNKNNKRKCIEHTCKNHLSFLFQIQLRQPSLPQKFSICMIDSCNFCIAIIATQNCECCRFCIASGPLTCDRLPALLLFLLLYYTLYIVVLLPQSNIVAKLVSCSIHGLILNAIAFGFGLALRNESPLYYFRLLARNLLIIHGDFQTKLKMKCWTIKVK